MTNLFRKIAAYQDKINNFEKEVILSEIKEMQRKASELYSKSRELYKKYLKIG